MGYVINEPNRIVLEGILEWHSDGKLISHCKVIGSESASTSEVDVDAVIAWLEKNSYNDVFEFVNKVDCDACNWVMVQSKPGGSAVKEADYTRYLWGITPKQLAEFIKKGYTNESL